LALEEASSSAVIRFEERRGVLVPLVEAQAAKKTASRHPKKIERMFSLQKFLLQTANRRECTLKLFWWMPPDFHPLAAGMDDEIMI
jgi:hypothetical protein